MRTFSDTNPLLPHITFHMLREDKVENVHSRLTETIAQVVRWAVVGVLVIIITLPVILSVTSSM